MRSITFVTTPIFYLNSAPHLGHAYSLLLAEAIARFHSVPLVTGTDEHGTKVSQAALKQQLDVKQYCDKQSLLFKDLLGQIGVEAACFIRTTDSDHRETVCDFWNSLKKDLGLSRYQGFYCQSDESFVRASELTEDKKTVLGHFTQFMSELNYVFNLENYHPFLSQFVPSLVHPKNYIQPLLNDLSQLKMLSVSRPSSRVSWGIPVPDDPSQTIYVWIDALCNYLTAAKRLKIQNFGVCHVIGKDILKFHSIFWPALLKSADKQLPGKVLVHCHWTSLGRKMSKSLGNVVCPVQMVKKYGMDAFRLYCLTQGPLQTDRDFEEHTLKEVFNNFVSSFCNLVIRITAPKIIQKQMRLTRVLNQEERRLIAQITALIHDSISLFRDFRLKQVYINFLNITALLNKFTNDTEPWKKTLQQRTHLAFIVAESIRLTTLHLLVPFLPHYSEAVLSLLQSRESKFRNDGRVSIDEELRKKCHMKRVIDSA